MSDGSEDSRGNVTYLHELTSREKKDGKWLIHEESIIHGDRGLSFKYYHKEGDSIEKITGRQNPDGTFALTTIANGQKESRILSRDDLLKELGKLKHLKFAVDYIKSQKSSQGRSQGRPQRRRGSSRGSRGGARRVSRSTSRGRAPYKRRGSVNRRSMGSNSKRGSRSRSKRGSRSRSRKGSRKGSRRN